MIKLKSLQKRLIKLTIVSFAVVGLLGAGAAAVYFWNADLQVEKAKSQSKLTSTRRDITAREEKAKEALRFQELYKEIQAKEGSAELESLNREVGQKWIAEVGNIHRLTALSGKFNAIRPVANPSFKRGSTEVILSEVDLNFSAMTDEDMIQFVEALYRDFPGYVKIKSLELKRNNDISDEALVGLASGRRPELVSGQMLFSWMGVKEVVAEEASKEEGAANAK